MTEQLHFHFSPILPLSSVPCRTQRGPTGLAGLQDPRDDDILHQAGHTPALCQAVKWQHGHLLPSGHGHLPQQLQSDRILPCSPSSSPALPISTPCSPRPSSGGRRGRRVPDTRSLGQPPGLGLVHGAVGSSANQEPSWLGCLYF